MKICGSHEHSYPNVDLVKDKRIAELEAALRDLAMASNPFNTTTAFTGTTEKGAQLSEALNRARMVLGNPYL